MTVIGLLLFDEIDLLDTGGPYEVFLTAGRLAERGGEPAPFEVVTIGVGGEPVTAYGGLRLIPQASVDEVTRLDVLIVPGAIAIERVMARPGVMGAIATLAARADLTASVCTGAFLLSAAGLLGERPWTTHWEDVDLLARQAGAGGATRGVRWVDSGTVVTAGGLSSGIAMSLHLVDRLAGRELAERTARQIDYDWDPSGER